VDELDGRAVLVGGPRGERVRRLADRTYVVEPRRSGCNSRACSRNRRGQRLATRPFARDARGEQARCIVIVEPPDQQPRGPLDERR
jgi:hypothetical protein